MKLVFSLLFSVLLWIPAAQAEQCEERSWIVQIDQDSISKESLLKVLVSMGKAENTELVFHGLWYVLNDASNTENENLSLKSTLNEISKMDGVRTFCSATISM